MVFFNYPVQTFYWYYFIFLIDELQEVLLYFPEIQDIRPSAKIEDLNLVRDIALKCGYKVRFVAPPFADEKEEVVSV